MGSVEYVVSAGRFRATVTSDHAKKLYNKLWNRSNIYQAIRLLTFAREVRSSKPGRDTCYLA
jgi:hypothetical protein